jgi:catechol 2,3-dioxygenase-like lactoylglutathione lyase family enzyme
MEFAMKHFRTPWIATAFALALGVPALAADGAPPVRPHLLGVAQVAIYVHDIAASRAFYRDFLGYAEPFSIQGPDGGLRSAFIKIGDRQAIELIPEVAPATDRLVHVGLETDDAEGMRLYLKSRGIAVPDHVTKGRVAAMYFSVKDPDGHSVEFLQYGPDSWTTRDFGLHLPDTRLSPRMSHAGVMVRHLDAALAFYRDVLGCTETWRGSGDGRELSWVTMRVPDGADWIELMLYEKMPDLAHIGVSHHFCLEVPDVAKAGEILRQRPLPAKAVLSTRVAIGKNRRRQIRAFDPDGTRVEIMEPGTVDGQAAPSSSAPPPG